MKIYICCHKEKQLPVSDILQPIHVGKAVSNINLNMIGDNTGDNISEKNKNYCEMTATYWIWKNVKEDVVGLCHYRRYFNFKNEHVSSEHIKINKLSPDFAEWSGNLKEIVAPILKEYDVILPTKIGIKKHHRTIYDFYKKEHVISDLDMVLDVIKEKYPNQYETAYQVLHTEIEGYYANMLVTKKEIFDAYAEWIFGILFEVEKRIQKEVETRDTHQQRVYGFLAERLMTVYIALHPELKIKEVPIVFIEDNKKAWRKYVFRSWKRKILEKLGLRKDYK